MKKLNTSPIPVLQDIVISYISIIQHIIMSITSLAVWFLLLLTKFNKIAIQGTPQVAADKETISF